MTLFPHGISITRRLAFLATAMITTTACDPKNQCEGVDIIPASQTFTTEEVCEEAALYEASATIGYGTTEHSEFNEEVVLEVEHGPQGGQHIYGAVLLTGMNPGERVYSDPQGCGEAEVYDNISIIYTLSFPDELYPDVIGTFGWWAEGGTPEESFVGGMQIEMDIWTVINTYPDQLEIPIGAHVVVTDACGTTVEDSGSFMLSLDE
jgi:hypothetical protein